MPLGKRNRSRSNRAPKRAKRTFSKTYSKRRGMASLIKRVMLKQCETKHRKDASENMNLFHNKPYALPVITKCGIGTGENQRLGDEVIGKYVKCKFMFFSKNDRPNVTYRVIVYRAPVDEGDTYTDIMEGDIGNKVMDSVNTEKYTSVMQKYLKITGNTALGPDDLVGNYDWTLRENSKYLTFTVPLKDSKIKYQDNSEFPKYQAHTIKMVVFAYDAYGTLQTDNVGSFAYSTKFYYKDP